MLPESRRPLARSLAAALLLAWATPSEAQTLGPVRVEVDTAGNGVLEPNESVALYPYWRNFSFATWPGGPAALTNFTGPAGASYVVMDPTAGYDDFPPGQPLPGAPPQTCQPGNCYAPAAIRIEAPVRPVRHWDTTIDETHLAWPYTYRWRLHVGATFADVPPARATYRFVETLVHKDVTGGCTPTTFCPVAPVTREAMAVFLVVAREPRGYVPFPCGTTPMFADVPASSPFCPWIEDLARRGTTGGCGGGLYCPAAAVTRGEMAVLLLAVMGHTPPPCVIAPYADVPVTSPLCPYIAELQSLGITAGCGNGNYCPAALVTREETSVFLTRRFQLQLYGLF